MDDEEEIGEDDVDEEDDGDFTSWDDDFGMFDDDDEADPNDPDNPKDWDDMTEEEQQAEDDARDASGLDCAECGEWTSHLRDGVCIPCYDVRDAEERMEARGDTKEDMLNPDSEVSKRGDSFQSGRDARLMQQQEQRKKRNAARDARNSGIGPIRKMVEDATNLGMIAVAIRRMKKIKGDLAQQINKVIGKCDRAILKGTVKFLSWNIGLVFIRYWSDTTSFICSVANFIDFLGITAMIIALIKLVLVPALKFMERAERKRVAAAAA